MYFVFSRRSVARHFLQQGTEHIDHAGGYYFGSIDQTRYAKHIRYSWMQLTANKDAASNDTREKLMAGFLVIWITALPCLIDIDTDSKL